MKQIDKQRWIPIFDESACKTDDDRLELYRAFYDKRDAFIHEYRGNRVSDLLQFSDNPPMSPIRECGTPMFSLNHPHRLTSLIREHESHIEYISEGLLATYPIAKLIERYRKFCKENLDTRLTTLKIDSVCKEVESNQTNKSIVEYVYHNKNNPSLIVFRFPFFSDDSAEEFIKGLVDNIYLVGYNLSVYGKLKQSSVVQPFQDEKIDVWYIQFEAKFSEPQPDLSDTLYHIAPSRYFEKIKVQGLIPRAKSDRFKYPNRVYLFNTKDISVIERYGTIKVNLLKTHHQNIHVSDNGFYLFAVKRENLEKYQPYIDKKTIFYLDPCYDGGLGGVQNSKAIFTYNNIPRNLIEDICWYYELDDTDSIKSKRKVSIK